MATFTQDTNLVFRTGSNVSQPDANQKTRDIFRSFLSTYVDQLEALKHEGETVPTLVTIATMTTAQMKPWVQRIVRGFIRDSARAFDVATAETTHVKPVREKADATEDAE